MGRRIELNNWYLNGNKLEIHLTHYYVSIELNEDNKYKVSFWDGFMDQKSISFDTLEEAVRYTEDILNKPKSKTLTKKNK